MVAWQDVPLATGPADSGSGPVPATVRESIEAVGRELDRAIEKIRGIADVVGLQGDTPVAREELFRSLVDRAAMLDQAIGRGPGPVSDRLDIFHGYVAVFVISFAVTLLITPLMRRLALRYGVIDRPSEARKIHRIPVAYLGGVAVFLGILAGIVYSYLALYFPALLTFHQTRHLIDGLVQPVPVSVLVGLTAIMLVGLLDDVVGIRPHVKIGGQLIAAAALASDDVGVKVAAGVLAPLGDLLLNNRELLFEFNLPVPLPLLGSHVQLDLIYWAGTAVIAVFVLGACNAANLVDGMDGLLTGLTAVACAGLLIIALTLAAQDDGPRDAQRLVLCLAVMGAALGFLPHNFNPATIFLGDCGAMLLGFATIVIILTLGDRGQTHLVLAGLIIYAVPIIDTVLAIIRRKIAGRALWEPDDQHLHHMLGRVLGVKGAVLVLYAIGAGFACLGVGIVAVGRARAVYALALVFAAFIVVAAIKAARRQFLEQQALRQAGMPVSSGASPTAGLAGATTGPPGIAPGRLSTPTPEPMSQAPGGSPAQVIASPPGH